MTHDDLHDDDLLLASAYLDGELTAEERARAESDPAVMELVTGMGDVRARLALDPDEQADVERREAGIAAALAAAGPSTVVAPPAPLAAARRRARWGVPLAAAAALVVVVGGVVALRAGDGSGDDEAGRALDEEVFSVDDEDAARAPAPAAGQTAVTEPETPAEAEVAEDAESTEATEAASAEATVAAADLLAGPLLETAADLRDFAAAAATATGTIPAAAEESAGDAASAPCRTDALLGVATASVAGEVVEVEVYAVGPPDELLAVATGTCEVVLQATP